jgi:membrane-bound lytic murein transglycosylase D
MKIYLFLFIVLLLRGICSAEERFQADGSTLLPNPVLSTQPFDFVHKSLRLTPATDSDVVKLDSRTTISNLSVPQLKTTDDIQQLSAPIIPDSKSDLESIVNPVDRIIEIYTGRIRDRYQTYLERSTRYVGLMKQILRTKGVPENVAYLSLVESGFNPNACSRAKAVGQWQFIEETAKRYGLHIDFWHDERKDPVKATQAAADYLKDLYNQFGSWELAMAAYNAGENKIQRLVSRDNLKDYLDVSRSASLADETKKYVPGYLATLRIVANPKAYGFVDLKYEPPIDYDEVIITNPATIDTIAKAAGSTVHVIRGLNPELKQWCTPLNTTEYLLRIPKGTADDFIKKLDNSNMKPGDIIRQYTVRKKDTVKSISRHTGVSEGIIIAMNPGLSLKAGNNVMLPPENAVVDTSHLKMVKNIKNKIKQYAFHKTARRDRHKTLYATKGHGLKHHHSG